MAKEVRSVKTLLVFPNDPLYRYEEKGEIKPRYFNPEDFFESIHIASLCSGGDSLETARLMAGSARVEVHSLGRPGPFSWRGVLARALELARQVKPDVIRAYNPLFMGYLAVRCARETSAASAVSIHADYDLVRNIRIYGPGYLLSSRGAYHLAHQLLGLNRTVFHGADHVICAYRFPLGYVSRWRNHDMSVIYNRVDLKNFRPADKDETPPETPLRILNVGRQFEGKNPEPILRAAAALENTRLTLVGNGPFHQKLKKLAGELNVSERVTFLERVPHERLPEVYHGHDIFAMAITHPGVCIPVLEAAACALPVVINRPLWEPTPEVVGELAEVVPLTADGYRQAFGRLAGDVVYRKTRGEALRARVLDYGGEKMEHAEREVYQQLIEKALVRKAG